MNSMTLKLKGDLTILKMYPYTDDEVAELKHTKQLIMYEICMVNKKIQKQLSRSKGKVKCHKLPTTSIVHHGAH